MFKNYIIIIGLILIAGCREVYDPDIDNEKTALVVQGLLTNQQGQMSVKITEAVPYDSADTQIPVKGAFVSVSDDIGNEIILSERGFGIYDNYDIAGVSGRTYTLKIATSDGDVYESTPQTMPTAFNQDSIYAERISRVAYIPTTSGTYFETQEKGIETYVDLSSKSNELPKCRYEVRTTIMYTYLGQGLPPPTVYCWKTFNPGSNLNITNSKFEKTIGLAPKHKISFFNENIRLYDEREGLALAGWLLSLKKYSLSGDAHQYYISIKNQMEASGKIFDPVPSQINGNIKCINHPEKLVFGFFEVSFVENLYYRYDMGQRKISLIPKDGFPGFTDEGEVVGIPPLFWNY